MLVKSDGVVKSMAVTCVALSVTNLVTARPQSAIIEYSLHAKS